MKYSALLSDSKLQQKHSNEIEEYVRNLYKKDKDITLQELLIAAEEVRKNVNPDTDRVRKFTTVTGGLFRPMGGVTVTVTSKFGKRGKGFHKGIDLQSKAGYGQGQPVYAVADGVVTASYSQGNEGYGNVVYIKHPNLVLSDNSGPPIETRYAHLFSRDVSEGDTVKALQKIGVEGNTGGSSGTHLHFEIRVNGEAINPLQFLDQTVLKFLSWY